MNPKFLSFFYLVAIALTSATAGNWIIQYGVDGEIDVLRAAFQICLVGLVLYLLWRRTIPGYVVALGYATADAILDGFALAQYLGIANASQEIPTSAAILAVVTILSTVAALIILAGDYLAYRKRFDA